MKQEQIEFILEGLEMAMNSNYFWYKGDHYFQTKGVAMGARYAPSVAKLFINKWEEEQIYSVERPNLKFYRGYIDNIVMIWKGMEVSLKSFFDKFKENRHGI